MLLRVKVVIHYQISSPLEVHRDCRSLPFDFGLWLQVS